MPNTAHTCKVVIDFEDGKCLGPRPTWAWDSGMKQMKQWKLTKGWLIETAILLKKAKMKRKNSSHDMTSSWISWCKKWTRGQQAWEKSFRERLLCYLTRILKTSDSMRVLRPANAFSPAHLNSKKTDCKILATTYSCIYFWPHCFPLFPITAPLVSGKFMNIGYSKSVPPGSF